MSKPRPKRRAVAPFRAFVESLGGFVVDAGFTGGDHIKLRVRYGGREKIFFVAATPSDVRTRRNEQAFIRRWMAANREEQP